MLLLSSLVFYHEIKSPMKNDLRYRHVAEEHFDAIHAVRNAKECAGHVPKVIVPLRDGCALSLQREFERNRARFIALYF